MREQERALTRKRTLWGGGVLEIGYLRLLEDGSKRSGALGFDAVASETASEGQDGNGEKVGMSTGADTNANTRSLRSRLEHGTAYLSDRIVELPLRPSAKSAPPWGPILL